MLLSRWGSRVGSAAGGEVRENRRFVRVRPSGLASRVGKIIVNPKMPAIDRSVLDISAGGACLEVCGGVELPKRFELVHGATRRKCLMVWKTGRRFGVSF